MNTTEETPRDNTKLLSAGAQVDVNSTAWAIRVHLLQLTHAEIQAVVMTGD